MGDWIADWMILLIPILGGIGFLIIIIGGVRAMASSSSASYDIPKTPWEYGWRSVSGGTVHYRRHKDTGAVEIRAADGGYVTSENHMLVVQLRQSAQLAAKAQYACGSCNQPAFREAKSQACPHCDTMNVFYNHTCGACGELAFEDDKTSPQTCPHCRSENLAYECNVCGVTVFRPDDAASDECSHCRSSATFTKLS